VVNETLVSVWHRPKFYLLHNSWNLSACYFNTDSCHVTHIQPICHACPCRLQRSTGRDFFRGINPQLLHKKCAEITHLCALHLHVKCVGKTYTLVCSSTAHQGRECINYKLNVTVHRCLQEKAPRYTWSTVAHQFRKSPAVDNYARPVDNTLMTFNVPPHYRLSTFGRLRAFSVAGPTSWNSLPDRLRDPTLSSDSFRGNYL